MVRILVVLPAFVFLLDTLVPNEDGSAAAALDHDSHPGLGHAEEGEGDHHHGDPDDHHETPDSPCDHHEGHTCCASGQVIGLPGGSTAFETPSRGYLDIPCSKPSILPAASELFHVPLT